MSITLTDVKSFVVKFVKEVATLQRPVTAAAAVATVVGVLTPLGIDPGQTATAISGILVAIGTGAATLENLFGVLHFK